MHAQASPVRPGSGQNNKAPNEPTNKQIVVMSHLTARELACLADSRSAWTCATSALVARLRSANWNCPTALGITSDVTCREPYSRWNWSKCFLGQMWNKAGRDQLRL